jgi:hypothetical protein
MLVEAEEGDDCARTDGTSPCGQDAQRSGGLLVDGDGCVVCPR